MGAKAEGVAAYNEAQTGERRAICDALFREIALGLPDAEGKIWHGGPVWFIEGNPIVGYWSRKTGVQLLFWSGQSFDEPGLKAEGKFKAAEATFSDPGQIDTDAVQRWLAASRVVQWDYKNIVKRRGRLERLEVSMATS